MGQSKKNLHRINPEEFNAFYNKYSRLVLKMAWDWADNAQDAQDIAQMTWAAMAGVWRDGRLHLIRNAMAYLRKVVRTTAAKHFEGKDLEERPPAGEESAAKEPELFPKMSEFGETKEQQAIRWAGRMTFWEDTGQLEFQEPLLERVAAAPAEKDEWLADTSGGTNKWGPIAGLGEYRFNINPALRGLVERQIETLSPRQREVLRLYLTLPKKEAAQTKIAEKLGISQSTVWRDLKKALAALGELRERPKRSREDDI